MFNKVILVGNLARDVELKYFQNGGGCVATFGLGVNRKYKKQDGSQAQEVCFIDCKVFGRTAEIANQYLKKGSKVLIEGRLAQEQWEQNGQKKSKHIIQCESLQLMDSKPQSQEQNKYKEAYQNAPEVDMSQRRQDDVYPESDEDKEDAPF